MIFLTFFLRRHMERGLRDVLRERQRTRNFPKRETVVS
jgi:hypothetical protein